MRIWVLKRIMQICDQEGYKNYKVWKIGLVFSFLVKKVNIMEHLGSMYPIKVQIEVGRRV